MVKYYIGQKFERLTIIDQVILYKERKNKSRHIENGKPEYIISGESYVICKCDCGVTKLQRLIGIIKGNIKSCGCLVRDNHKPKMIKHGMYNTITYKSWRSMLGRCNNVNDPSYGRYGGRGIKVCDRWLKSFENFYEDMGERPSKQYSLDRIDNNGNYELDNCKWSTNKEQMNNTSMNIKVKYNGILYNKCELSRILFGDKYTLSNRIRGGWDMACIFNTKKRVNHKNG